MTADTTASVRASRLRVPRTRGALSGVLLVLFGAWAALVPFIGPYFNFAFTPSPNSAWHWTAARAYLEVFPGAAAFLGGLLLLVSTSRLTTSFGGWLGVAGGAWLIVGAPLASVLGIQLGTPDPSSSKTVQALEALLFFFAIGAAILFVAALAIGRLSVHSVRDVRAAERRAAAEEAAAQQRRAAEERRAAEDQGAADEQRGAEERRTAEERQAAAGSTGPQESQPAGAAGWHEGRAPGDGETAAPNYPQSGSYPAAPPADYPPAGPQTQGPPPPPGRAP